MANWGDSIKPAMRSAGPESKLDRQVLTRLDRERLVEAERNWGREMRLQHRNVVPVANPPDKPQINNLPHTPVSERRVGFALAAVAAMTVFSGIWEGRINHRWGRRRPRLPPPNNWRQSPATLATALQSSGVLDKSLPSINCNVPDRLSAPMSRSGRVNKSPSS